MKTFAAALTVIGILASGWLALAVYIFAWTPWQRHQLSLAVAGLTYAPGPVVLLGDSIMQGAARQCRHTINLAVAGSDVASFPSSFVDAVASARPSAVVILSGVNDLRRGATPQDTSEKIAGLAAALRRALPSATLSVLSVLPVQENEIAGQATNDKIRQTNRLLAELNNDGFFDFFDVADRFGGGRLLPDLTYDGLHLNEAGVARLDGLLFSGLARRTRTAAPQC
ncbi:MAG: GDSL-type esterase/lipase family protein [Beijerinckiaceae bacterium]|nr:GDSL-type esterase/lipase family protein [Beijerinckiaceae bacterium]